MENEVTPKTVSDFKLGLGRLLGNNFYGLSISESTYFIFIKPKTPKHSIDNIPSDFNGLPTKVIKSVPIMPLIA